ncbi:radical SAM protein [Thermofilum pendens]|uniref:Radical SAM domain protein n=1 Tax=Thermofilum pendens (strain DSM 2475 / Hrk 5) TaxID=368408 RepID=A1RZM2_THEPD|nr:radical SAM protein [Thermofilum pendens]ABL78652.1 Radical SAM domain protein [Thermofilum pendens Hrk 5]
MWRISLYRKLWSSEKECKVCGKKSMLVSEAIGVCAECLRSDPGAVEVALEGHRKERASLGLPPDPPRDPRGTPCGLCNLGCRIPEGGLGYCGLVKNEGGRIVHLSGQPGSGVLEYYYDPHPTNCVAFWFCPGATGAGYPRYAVRPGCEEGYVNLAVFYGACNHNCAFCQNWFYRRNAVSRSPRVSVEELLEAALDPRVTCVCFFGGDPAPQVLHALAFTRELLERARGRIMRVCWESNGHFSPKILPRVIEASLRSGGTVKFDLKAWSPGIYRALTGVEQGSLLDNAGRVAEAAKERPEVPLFTASTLLVPGYVDEEEVRAIARFLASLSPDIPYTLLAFHPDHRMLDLPPTSRRHAEEAARVAREEGLLRVRIGNPWLLGDYY